MWLQTINHQGDCTNECAQSHEGGKSLQLLPPNAKSSTDLVEVILPSTTPRIVMKQVLKLLIWVAAPWYH